MAGCSLEACWSAGQAPRFVWKKGLVFYRREGDGGWPFVYPVAVAEVVEGGVADEFPGQRVLAGGGRVGGEYRDAGQAVGAVNGCSAGPG